MNNRHHPSIIGGSEKSQTKKRRIRQRNKVHAHPPSVTHSVRDASKKVSQTQSQTHQTSAKPSVKTVTSGPSVTPQKVEVKTPQLPVKTPGSFIETQKLAVKKTVTHAQPQSQPKTPDITITPSSSVAPRKEEVKRTAQSPVRTQSPASHVTKDKSPQVQPKTEVKLTEEKRILPSRPLHKTPQITLSTGPVSSERTSRLDRHYAEVFETIKSSEIKPDFTSLGNISGKAEYYFEESIEAKAKTIQFLQDFWSDIDNREATVQHHQHGFKKFKGQAHNPSCISFITAEINGKPFCFVALSSMHKISNKFKDTLKEFINTYNRTEKSGNTEFVLLDGHVANFSELVRLSAEKSGAKSPTKTCSEKFYASCLTKLFLEHGSALKVTGVVNCDFYPFEADDHQRPLPYGTQENPIDPYVLPPNLKTFLALEDETIVPTKPCCLDCRKNKDTILKIFKVAQDYADGLVDETKLTLESKKRLETSPVRNSLATQSSLQSQSLFKMKTGHDASLKVEATHEKSTKIAILTST